MKIFIQQVGLLNNLTNSKKEKQLSVYIAIKIPVLITATRIPHGTFLIILSLVARCVQCESKNPP